MQLVINTFGAFLSKDGDCFEVRADGKSQKISVKKVQSILISTSATITTDAIKLAVENNIDIIFIDIYGEPYGRVWQPKLGSTTAIRRRQIELYDSSEGLEFALEWITRKFDNQAEFLIELMSRRESKKTELANWIASLRNLKEKLRSLSGTIDEKRETIMGLEGSAGRIYFNALNFVIPEDFKFKGRSRHPAKDPFNCLLNYAYGVLYSIVEKACIIAGLEPYTGFIHTDNYGKKSLVFDIIESYRIIAEKTVFYLFSKRMVKKNYFDPVKDGIALNKEGKAILICSLNEELDKKLRYRGRNISQRDIIQFNCHQFAQKLIGKE